MNPETKPANETIWLGATLLAVLVYSAVIGTDARTFSVSSSSALALCVFGMTALFVQDKFGHLWRDGALVLFCLYVASALAITMIFSDVKRGDALHGSLALFGFAAAYATATALCKNCRIRLLWSIATLAFALSVYGLIAHQVPVLYLTEKIYNQQVITATFTNPNHLATFLGFGTIAALALTFNRGEFSLKGLLIFLSCLLTHTQTGSRAGLAATLLGILSLALLKYLRVQRHPIGAALKTGAVTFTLAVLGMLIVAFNSETAERFVYILPDAMKRGTLYADVVAAVFHSPLTGYGLGSFEGVFRIYQSEQLSVDKAWLSAHSAPLEVIFETGVIVFCLIPLAALTYARSALCSLKIDDCPTKFAGLGVFVSGSAHSLFDNTLSIPAVGLTFAVGLGLANSVRE